MGGLVDFCNIVMDEVNSVTIQADSQGGFAAFSNQRTFTTGCQERPGD
jgi:hypothetical protein